MEGTPAERFAVVLELFEFALEQHRANLRRRHPELDEAAIEDLLDAWLLERPGAELGDAAGKPRALSRMEP